MRSMVSTYYEGELRCDDMTCGLITKQLSVNGKCCLARGCRGKMEPVFSERDLWTQFTYYESLFDIEHCVESKAVKEDSDEIGYDRKELEAMVGGDDKKLYGYLRGFVKNMTEMSAYNFVRPSLFSMFFGGAAGKGGAKGKAGFRAELANVSP